MLLMNVFSGHRIDPLHIREEDIYLEDIAHALSLLCVVLRQEKVPVKLKFLY